MPTMEPGVINYAPEPFKVELRDRPKPEITENDILMRVGAVGVCGSDLHQWHNTHSWKVNYPCVLGHEFGGTIVEVGKNVKNWKEGDRVVSETAAIIDTENPMSKIGRYNLDPTRRGFGNGVDGAMTHHVRVPARCLHKIPDNVPFEIAALTEPCCVAYNAVVMNAHIKPGDRIVVLGPGPIGVLSAALAKLSGAQVALVGLKADRTRLDIAKAYGVEPLTENVEAWARDKSFSDGLGADGVIDATGVSVALKTAIDIVRPQGWISKVGWGPQPYNFSLDTLVRKNVTLQGSYSHNWPIWERILRMFSANLLDVRPIIGGIWPLHQWHTAFETMHSGKIVKAVLKP